MIKTIFAISLVTVLLAANFEQVAFAQMQIVTAPTSPSIFFMGFHVDANPVPNKPFTITADIQDNTVNWANMMAYITAPKGISTISPIFSNLAFTNAVNTVRATWTVMAGDTGSYPIVITAHSNFPVDTQSFTITVNVGSPHSIFVSGIEVPGNIFPNDDFTVGVRLKNAAPVPDSNVMSQIFVPAGLQLLDPVTLSVQSIKSDQEVDFKWKIRAENAGAYTIGFNYSSTNSGSNSISSNVNVGSRPLVTGGLVSMSTRPISLEPNAINLLTLDIKNNGVQDVHNLQIVSAAGIGYTSVNTPDWIGELPKDARKTETLKIATSNQTLSLQIPIQVRYDSDGNNYSETYTVGLNLENKPNFKIGSITLTPTQSYAGDIADKINVQIFNAGIVANDVYTKLILPPGLSPAWGNSTTAYFGKIDTFQTETVSFYVNVDNRIVSGSYPLTLFVNTGNQTSSLHADFVVAQKAIFNLVSLDDSQLYPGASNVPFKIVLKNTGTASAQTITTKLLSGNDVAGVKSNTLTTVGNIENIGTALQGQVFTTTFLVSLDPTSTPGDQATSVEIDWTQNGTNNFVQTITIPYHIANGPYYALYYHGIPLTYLAIIVLLSTGVFVFIKKRKKRLRLMHAASLEIKNAQGLIDFPSSNMLDDISAIKDNEPIFPIKEITSNNDQEKSDKKSKKPNQ
jgi:hypothetical protein